MAKMIKLERNLADGVEHICVNADLVRLLAPTGDGGTKIDFSNDHSVTVNHTLDEVEKAIRA